MCDCPNPARARRILLAGATGYIGRVVAAELLRRGHSVIAPVRDEGGRQRPDAAIVEDALAGVMRRVVELTDAVQTAKVLDGLEVDATISCLASRSGIAADAWAVDHRANANLLVAAKRAGAKQFVLLSAICVQRPRLAFQHAKLAFEAALMDSGIDYTVVRPTAFFKSLSGQVGRVRQGKPFLLFGDGRQTACKPIGERDLARFLADCLEDPASRNQMLPIGGPGAAITPREQGQLLFELTGQKSRFRQVPVAVFDAALASLTPLAKLSPRFAAKAELARIGRYYATESMLLWNESKREYDADATPSYGEETLRDFYVRVLEEGLAGQSLGDQALF